MRRAERPAVGSLEAQRPLQIVEVDHTVLDVHVVDPETLDPIGRPVFTVAIDVFTRCVLGFVLLLMPPGALAAALCLQRVRFRKEEWLKRMGLDAEWPMYGAPSIVHRLSSIQASELDFTFLARNFAARHGPTGFAVVTSYYVPYTGSSL